MENSRTCALKKQNLNLNLKTGTLETPNKGATQNKKHLTRK
jgi:hypothetical protein